MVANIETILYALTAGLFYGLIIFARKRHETFDPYKFLSTMFVAGFIGLLASFSDATITEEYFLLQLTSYAGMIVIVENLLKGAIKGNYDAFRHSVMDEVDLFLKKEGIEIDGIEWESIMEKFEKPKS